MDIAITLNTNSLPLHQQLYEQLRAYILTGKLPPGTRMRYGVGLLAVQVEGVRRLKTVLDTNVYKATSLLSLTQKFLAPGSITKY